MEQMIRLTVQGRCITASEIKLVRNLLDTNPSWNRTRLSKELCLLWNWRRTNGEFKDIACRSLLRKLEQLGYIRLPKGQNQSRRSVHGDNIQPILHSRTPIREPLKSLYPIELRRVEKGPGLNEFKYYISAYHYLGWSGTVGENLKYLFFDVHKRPLGCMMFGACAWKVEGRDRYIGWNASERVANLSYVVNNNRFLILPWVEVGNLASHILGKISRRINRDWQEKYHHPVYLMETFVDKQRYPGTCYKAANWVHAGVTKGRGKLDVKKQYLLPVKDIWLYPLDPFFRQKLCNRWK